MGCPFTHAHPKAPGTFNFYGCADKAVGGMSWQVVMDRDSGRSKGFGFVTFDTEAGCERAIREVGGTPLSILAIF